MKRHSKDLIKALTNLGFDHVWTNAQGHHCYVHPDDPAQEEVSVSPSISSDSILKMILRRARKIAGAEAVVEKRKATQVKERAEAERERARQRLQWVKEKQQRLIADQADPTWIAKVHELIDLRERELAAIERLMKEPAQGGNVHRGAGQARHYTGSPC
jgi:predicted RNA binding protein YcfA (HicA-like mRNA interferase family)